MIIGGGAITTSTSSKRIPDHYKGFERSLSIDKRSQSLILKFFCARSINCYSIFVYKWLEILQYIRNKQPKSILSIYKNHRFERHKAKISNSNIPKSKKYEKNFLYEHTSTFNEISNVIKIKSRFIFKKELKMWISSRQNDTMD